MGLFSKITRSITKPLKKVIKSPFGKAALLGLGAYYGGQAGMFGKGIQDQGWKRFIGTKAPWLYSPGVNTSTMQMKGMTPIEPSGIIGNLANKWSGMSGLGKAATIGGATALTAGIAAPKLEEKVDIDVDDPTGHANYLTNRGMYEDEWAEWLVSSGKAETKEEALELVRNNPMFSGGGRVKANTGLYAGGMGGMNQGMNPMTMNQGIGAMNAMGMGSPRNQMRQMGGQDPRMAKMNQMQNINRGIQSVKPPTQSEDAELIQLIKMLTSMGIPMEQLRGRTKEELVELVVSVKGKMQGERGVKETAEVIEEEDIREQNQAAGGGLMRTGYAIGAEVEGDENMLIKIAKALFRLTPITGAAVGAQDAYKMYQNLDSETQEKVKTIGKQLAKGVTRMTPPGMAMGLAEKAYDMYQDRAGDEVVEEEEIIEGMNQGGLTRTGYAIGSAPTDTVVEESENIELAGTDTPAEDLEDLQELRDSFFDVHGREPASMDELKLFLRIRRQATNQGGLMRTGYAMGTSQFGLMGNEHPIIPSKDGNQLDMRQTGGYQPHGKAEKHDDVRALLAQGEFVMTSDAVKGMGGGDREAGAKKMYDLMHNMEAMA